MSNHLMSELNDTRLTIEEIRACEGFEGYEDEEISRLADFMHEFCIMAYEVYQTQQSNDE